MVCGCDFALDKRERKPLSAENQCWRCGSASNGHRGTSTDLAPRELQAQPRLGLVLSFRKPRAAVCTDAASHDEALIFPCTEVQTALHCCGVLVSAVAV